MKTFKDLEFKKHMYYPIYDTVAKCNFKNNYGVIVITGKNALTDTGKPYETAITYKGKLTNVPIELPNLSFLDEKDVTEIMKQIQKI